MSDQETHLTAEQTAEVLDGIAAAKTEMDRLRADLATVTKERDFYREAYASATAKLMALVGPGGYLRIDLK
jgi:hypothetical protein